MATILSLNAVRVEVAGTPVVVDATCQLGPGECLAILGPNGAGKTTLLRVMATLLKPTSGYGEVFGVSLTGSEIEQTRSRIGLSGHLPALSPSLTMAENLGFVARLSDRPPQSVTEALDLVGLAGAADRPVQSCSHGMKKRADLARLFISQPELLLLDEPYAGLDSAANVLVAEMVDRVRSRGGAAVLVSHDPNSVLALADQHLTLDAGVLSAK